jgi:hypothetical protein
MEEMNYVVEALEGFEDEVYGKKERVKVGERRIVAPNLLFRRRSLPPVVKEHAYELKMERKLKKLVENEVFVFGDCAVNPTRPWSSWQTSPPAPLRQHEFGIEPRVAMLSYSTGESGKGADVDKVREATRRVRSLRPDLAVEGPIQYDAAVDPSVARTKLPGSQVAGRATVLIFPI